MKGLLRICSEPIKAQNKNPVVYHFKVQVCPTSFSEIRRHASGFDTDHFVRIVCRCAVQEIDARVINEVHVELPLAAFRCQSNFMLNFSNMPRSCSDSYYVQLVYEYLLHMGMERTARLLQEECSESNYPPPQAVDGVPRSVIADLLSLFDDENEAGFFQAFYSSIPCDDQQSVEFKRLTVDLLVYFAALSLLKEEGKYDDLSMKPLVHLPPQLAAQFHPKPSGSPQSNATRSSFTRTDVETLERYDVPFEDHPCGRKDCPCPSKPASSLFHDQSEMVRRKSIHINNEDGQKARVRPCMCTLLCFLERECSKLRSDPYFSPYFALPFTDRPQCHPQYRHIFQDEWVSSLRKRLWDFLVCHRQSAKVPEIVLLLPYNESVRATHPNSITHNSRCQSINLEHHTLNSVSMIKSPRKQAVSLSSDTGHTLDNKNTAGSEWCTELNVCHQSPDVYSSFKMKGTRRDKIHDRSLIEENAEEDTSLKPTEESNAQHIAALRNNSPTRNIGFSTPYVHTLDHSAPPRFHRKSRTMQTAVLEGTESSMTSPNLNQERPALDCDYSSQHLKTRYHQLHSDYHNLIGVAVELTGALENSLQGKNVNLKEILTNCSQMFPELFQPNSQNGIEERAKQDDSVTNKQQSQEFTEGQLDMSHVKKHLTTGNVKTRLLLLQALRWRVTHKRGEERESAVTEYVNHDIFNVRSVSILYQLLAPPNVLTPHPLQQATARLVNAIASLRCGRDYLAQNSTTVTIIAGVLRQDNGVLVDRITKDMLVAALQKLSLRRSQRELMIVSDLFEWLIDRLCSLDSENAYSLEYSTALLMNLSLHSSAKIRCLPIAKQVFSLIIQLLSTQITQALPYINGTLYSFLTHVELNQVAATMSLAEALEENYQVQPDLSIKKQLEYILKFHRSQLLCETIDCPPPSSSEGEMIDEDNEEIDLLEEELDLNDPIRSIIGELKGEDLLRAHYSLPSNSHEIMQDKPPPVPSTDMLVRPTTPILRQNTPGFMSSDSEGVVIPKSYQQKPRLSSREARRKPRQEREQGQKHRSPKRGLSGQKIPLDQTFTQPYSKQDTEDKLSKAEPKSTNTNFHSEKSKLPYQVGSTKQSQRTTSAIVEGVAEHTSIFSKKCSTLPEITIQSASRSEDDDSDVRVDALEISRCTKESSGEDQRDVKGSSGSAFGTESAVKAADVQIISSPSTQSNTVTPKENTDVTAFASRPRIPRTPPRHS